MKAEPGAVLDALADRIVRLPSERPVRLAIDGRTASGKTTFADALAGRIQNRPVIRTSIDGFHRPKAARYAQGRYSAEGYYYDARDLAAVRSLLLAPLGPGGDRFYRTASFDLDRDMPVDEAARRAPGDAVLIVDGTFLQRPELRDGWDAAVFIKTSEAVSERRGVTRDKAALGGEQATRKLYAARYRPAFDLYEQLCAPEQSADAIVNNDDFDRPHMQVRPDGRLAAGV